MTYQLRNVVIAVALGVLAVAFTALYVTNYRKSVQHDEQSVGVLVAKSDIPAGTPGSAVISGHMLKEMSVPRASLVPGAISNQAQIARLVSTGDVLAGEQVSTRRFGNASELGVRAQLKGPLRAIQVSADPNQILAGTLKAGDHVDLVGNLRVENDTSGATRHYDRVFLRNLLVLKAPDLTGDKTNLGTTSKYSVMLAVTDAQASKLLFVVKNSDGGSAADGGWALELRPVAGSTDSPDSLESVTSVLLDGLGPAARAHALSGGIQTGGTR
jgi:Flp pilus assembly protein CpaB